MGERASPSRFQTMVASDGYDIWLGPRRCWPCCLHAQVNSFLPVQGFFDSTPSRLRVTRHHRVLVLSWFNSPTAKQVWSTDQSLPLNLPRENWNEPTSRFQPLIGRRSSALIQDPVRREKGRFDASTSLPSSHRDDDFRDPLKLNINNIPRRSLHHHSHHQHVAL